MRRYLPLVFDALVVIVFAAIGRRNHGEGDALTGVVTTAWPFLAAAAIGWGIVLVTRGLAAGRTLAAGATVWLSTVVFGMVLRHLSARGVAVSFIVVTLIFTGLFMLGWRLVAALARRAQHRA